MNLKSNLEADSLHMKSSILGNIWIICISMFVGNKIWWQPTRCQKRCISKISTPWVVLHQKAQKYNHMFSMDNDHQKGSRVFPQAVPLLPAHLRMNSPQKAPRKPSETASCDGPCRAGNNGLMRKGFGGEALGGSIPRVFYKKRRPPPKTKRHYKKKSWLCFFSEVTKRRKNDGVLIDYLLQGDP